MGVVRREGEWRLEKRDEGLYEVTYQRERQAEIRTPGYRPGLGDDITAGLVPVHKVDSYAEAEGLFEEFAHGGPPASMGGFGVPSSASTGTLETDSTAQRRNTGLDFEEDLDVLKDIENVPPGGLSLVFLITGGLFISTSGITLGEPVFLIGAGLILSGFVIIGWAVVLGRTQSWDDAIQFLRTTGKKSGKSSSQSDTADETETTPPAPTALKNKLIFERANQRCEWCGDQTDHPEVHHIEPRSEGGSNDESNLIVLCPACHRKADSGGISKTKLQGKLQHIRAK